MTTNRVCIDGVSYLIEYRKELSTNMYGRRSVYHVTTEEENYGIARKNIASIMNAYHNHKQGEIWSKGEYNMRYKQEPTMANAFHVYYEFKYDENIDKFIYIYVVPNTKLMNLKSILSKM